MARNKKVSRRQFIRASALTAAGIVVTSCAEPPEELVEEPVEEPTEEPVEEEPTEEPVEEEPTEEPVEEEPTEEPVEGPKYGEAPMLAALVEAGELPPVDERLPVSPYVVEPVEEIGEYGGTWRFAVTGPADLSGSRGYSLEKWIQFDPLNEEWHGVVAESLEISEDGREFTFHMRPGHRWSDGEPFTADDIMFWYEDIVKNDTLTPTKPGWMMIGDELGEVEKIDDTTVKFTFAEPHGMLLIEISFVWGGNGGLGYPAHFLKQFHADYVDEEELDQMVEDAGFETWDELFEEKNDYDTSPEQPTLRAWEMTKVEPPYLQERNPYYFKVDTEGNQLPYIDEIRISQVEDAEMITMKAVAGELDCQGRNISFDDITLYMDNREEGDYRVNTVVSPSASHVVFPNQNYAGDDEVIMSLIQDIRFRKALNLAINREEYNEIIHLGERKPYETLFPQFAGEPELFDFLQYDPERAGELLDDIGLEVGSDGLRLRPDGDQLIIRIDVFRGMMEGFELIASYFEDIGVRTSLEEISYDLWWPRIGSYEYEFCGYTRSANKGLARLAYFRSYAPIDGSTYWAPGWGEYYQTGGDEGVEPPPGSDAEKAQGLFDEIKLTVDTEKQTELKEECERLYLENVWDVVTMGGGPSISIVKNNFRNVPEEYSGVLHDSDNWAEQYFIRQS